LSIVFTFYPEQHEYFSFFSLRREPEIHAKAGKKLELPITKLFKWVSKNEIEVTLDKKYFELHTTSPKQVEKIAAIGNLISACKEMDVEHELVRKATSRWVNNLSYDLSITKKLQLPMSYMCHVAVCTENTRILNGL